MIKSTASSQRFVKSNIFFELTFKTLSIILLVITAETLVFENKKNEKFDTILTTIYLNITFI